MNPETEKLNDRLTEIQRNYKYLSDKVKEMLGAQKAYFKSNKDFQLLRKAKALEEEVNNIINPKSSSQAAFDWLAK